MLSRVPAQRQQTMREVIQDLRTAGRTQKNIPAFATEGTQISASGLTTNILGAAADPSAPATGPVFGASPGYQAPFQLSAPPASYVQPTPLPQSSYQPSAPPSYQPSAPPSYLQSTPLPQPSYQSQHQTPPPSYQHNTPMPPGYQPAPYRPPGALDDPARRARLVRLGEFLLGAAVVVIYLVVYWQDNMMFLRNFAKSLKFGL